MTDDRQDDERVDAAWHERTGGQARKNHREPEGSLWSSKRVEAGRILLNLKVAAGEDERATLGGNLTAHSLVGSLKGRDVRWACG